VETKSLVALRINLASPETIRSWSYGEVLNPRPSTTAGFVLKRTVCLTKRFSDRPGITNVIVENTKTRVIRGLCAINAE